MPSRRRKAVAWFIEKLEPRRLLASSPVVVDLLAVYTPAAASLHGGGGGMTQLIQQSVDSMNLALSNSRIGVTIRLVHTESINYSGSGDLFVDRMRLHDPSDGYMDGIGALRNQYGADVVALITDGNVSGGNADLLQDLNAPDNDTLAFTAIAENSMSDGNLTLAHEVGHLLGAGHERDNPTQPAVGPFDYSVGYRFTSNGVVYHDVMSYDPGIVVPYYANPAVTFHGVATGSAIGNPDEADLASTFAVTAPIVAAYRSSVVPDTTAPKAELYEVSQTGRTLTFTIRYSDDSGIDVSTIDSNDITVSAGGYNLAAGLLSVNNPGLGESFKLARYRIVLPETNPALSSLVFNMRPGAVRDINHHFVPTGAIAHNLSSATFDAFARARDLGTIATAETRTVYEQISTPFAFDDAYRFTISQDETVAATLTGLSADANVLFVQDLNHNDIFDSGEQLNGSYRTGTNDESFAQNLTAGTYFVYVYNSVTPYTLSLHPYIDSTPPTATLDARDITTAGTTQFVFKVAYTDDNLMDAVTTQYYAPVRLTNPFGGYYIYFPDSIDADFNAATRIATYRINAGFSLSAADNGVYTVSMEPQNSPIWGSNPLDNYVSDAAGNKLVTPATLGTFRVAIGQADVTAPTAAAQVATVQIGGGSTWDITVTYRDNVALDANSLDNSDLRITGLGGFNQLATFISVTDPPAIGGMRTAIYRITAPGGTFDPADDGTYTVSLQSGQVRDTSNNPVAGGTIAMFNVAVPLPGDANRDGIVDLRDLYQLATSFRTNGHGWSDGDFNYDGTVDARDLGLLSLNWQKTQALPSPAQLVSLTTSPRRTATRVITLI